MVDLLKITSPISSVKKVEKLPTKAPQVGPFEGMNPDLSEKLKSSELNKEEDNTKKFILKTLNRETLDPLLAHTRAQSDLLRKMVIMIQGQELASGLEKQVSFSEFFLRPEQMVQELNNRDGKGTIFKGVFFNSIRALARIPDQPALTDSIGKVLRAFDCCVKQEAILQSILLESENLMMNLDSKHKKMLMEALQPLKGLLDTENFNAVRGYLKKEYLPQLISLAKIHSGSSQTHNGVMAVIHHVIRYDHSDPALLEESVIKFCHELGKLMPLSQDESKAMLETLLNQSIVAKQELSQLENRMDSMEFLKGTQALQPFLQSLLQGESPLLPYLHFTLPVRFQEENTYGEFFVDKGGKSGIKEGKETTHIFFTLQTEKHGIFEVDLVEKDLAVEVEINAPSEFQEKVKGYKKDLSRMLETLGYRLTSYKVDLCKEGDLLLNKFPELGVRRAGIDVKV